MNSLPKLEDLIEFEILAIEKGFQLIKKRPLFLFLPTLTFSIEDLSAGSKKCVANISATARAFSLQTDEVEAIAPLLYLAAFKVLDMAVEHVLGINPYDKPVGFKGEKGKIERIRSEFKGGKLGFDCASAKWLGEIYGLSIDSRNPAIHKKIERTGILENAETIFEFVEAIYWLANLATSNPIKRARAVFETATNARQNLLTSYGNKVLRDRAFEIVQIVGENLNSIDPENLRLMVKRRLLEIHPDKDFSFHLLI